jgi:hypothetical protein
MSVTYALEWQGLEWEDDEQAKAWFIRKFIQKAREDGLAQLPCWTREGSSLMTVLRKEGNAFRVILNETNVAANIRSPEMPGAPPYLFYGPRAEIKIRTPTLQSLEQSLQILYPGGIKCTERLGTKEWALIGAINGGEIPASHRLVQQEPITVHPEAWNSEIFDAGLKTQNYDKGFDRFVRKFNPDEPMSAVMSVEKGVHSEFGSAILFAQENRRCLLLDTLHGLSEEEALWYAPEGGPRSAVLSGGVLTRLREVLGHA